MLPDESFPLALMESSAATLDITDTQRKQVEKSYMAVGEALCESSLLKHHEPVISPQGSFLLGTVVKPAPDAPFDVDGTCWLPFDSTRVTSSAVFNVVFQALKNHGTYKDMVTPKNRCVRVEYANSFHLDMTPCITNHSRQHAIHVPDRDLKIWKPSNPKLYAIMFEEAATKYPTIENELIRTENANVALSAKIDPIPPEEGFRKKLLKRLVQMLKRHRDVYFEKRPGAVISIILTTLAAKAYSRMVAQGSHPTLLEFAIRLVDDMSNHILIREVGGRLFFEVANPAVAGENFAEKWNDNPTLASAFFDWQRRLADDLRDFRNSALLNQGTPYLVEKAAKLYGEGAAKLAANELAQRTASAHRSGGLFITPELSLGSTGVKAKPTSYYGT